MQRVCLCTHSSMLACASESARGDPTSCRRLRVNIYGDAGSSRNISIAIHEEMIMAVDPPAVACTYPSTSIRPLWSITNS